jgi:hypothetical protein
MQQLEVSFSIQCSFQEYWSQTNVTMHVAPHRYSWVSLVESIHRGMRIIVSPYTVLCRLTCPFGWKHASSLNIIWSARILIDVNHSQTSTRRSVSPPWESCTVSVQIKFVVFHCLVYRCVSNSSFTYNLSRRSLWRPCEVHLLLSSPVEVLRRHSLGLSWTLPVSLNLEIIQPTQRCPGRGLSG